MRRTTTHNKHNHRPHRQQPRQPQQGDTTNGTSNAATTTTATTTVRQNQSPTTEHWASTNYGMQRLRALVAQRRRQDGAYAEDPSALPTQGPTHQHCGHTIHNPLCSGPREAQNNGSRN